MNEDIIQKFGFSEMYEWKEVPNTVSRIGKFVTFNADEHDKIELFNPLSKHNVLGVTTICSAANSDDPEEWKYSYMCNEYGDMYLRNERLAVGEKVYDELNELTYIRTRPWEHLIQIPNSYLDTSKKYVKRTNRQEWIRVNLMGKVIVEDDGTSKEGDYCTPYKGKLKEKFGTATAASENDTVKYYVIQRLTEKTIIILNK